MGYNKQNRTKSFKRDIYNENNNRGKNSNKENSGNSLKKTLTFLYIVFVLLVSSQNISAGDPWIDTHGTSSTAGTWNTGIRSDTNTTIYPPYVKRWEKYEWRGDDVNVVPAYNYTLIYDGYVYFGEGKHDQDS